MMTLQALGECLFRIAPALEIVRATGQPVAVLLLAIAFHLMGKAALVTLGCVLVALGRSAAPRSRP